MDPSKKSGQESQQDLSLRRFAREAFQDLTNLDSRIWLTVRGLARPGHLAVEWREGRGGRFLPPVRMYLIASALFFLFGSNSWLMLTTSAEVAAMLSADAVAGIDARVLQDAVLYRINSWAAIIRMASLIVLGLLLAVVAPRPGPRLVPSLVIAMHFYTVSFLLATLISLVLSVTGRLPDETAVMTAGEWLLNAERLIMLVWLTIAMRTAHGRSWLRTIFLSVLIWLVDSLLLVGAFGMAVGLMAELLES